MTSSPLRPEDLRFDPPDISVDRIAEFVRQHYQLSGEWAPLRGERDQNLLLVDSDGTKWVIKIASPNEEVETVDFQCRALEHLAVDASDLPVPRLRRSTADRLMEAADIDDEVCQLRVVSYIEGVTFDDAGPLRSDTLHAIGAFQGGLAASLASFSHPAASNFMPWALDSGMLQAEELWRGLASDARDIAEPVRARVDRSVGWMAGARRQIVHNDCHRGNVLRPDKKSGDVVGVIDFGDLVETPLVADLGISGASIVGGVDDPIAALTSLVRGFDSQHRLTDEELSAVPEMVLCRLVLSTLLVEYQIAHSPHIADAVQAERPDLLGALAIWSALPEVEVRDRILKELRP